MPRRRGALNAALMHTLYAMYAMLATTCTHAHMCKSYEMQNPRDSCQKWSIRLQHCILFILLSQKCEATFFTITGLCKFGVDYKFLATNSKIATPPRNDHATARHAVRRSSCQAFGRYGIQPITLSTVHDRPHAGQFFFRISDNIHRRLCCFLNSGRALFVLFWGLM